MTDQQFAALIGNITTSLAYQGKMTNEQGKKLDALISALSKVQETKMPTSLVLQNQQVKGDKGEPGYTPVKGKDYFTKDEIETIKKQVFKMIEIPKPIPGTPGKTPVKGKDYFTPQEIGKFIQDIRSTIEVPKAEQVDYKRVQAFVEEQVIQKAKEIEKLIPDASEVIKTAVQQALDAITPDEIKRQLESLKGDYRLDAKAIKNLPSNTIKHIYSGGGASTGGASLTELTTSSTVNGTNTTFAFTTKPKYVVSDGAWYIENNGWTWDGANVIMSVPPLAVIWAYQ